MFKSGFLRHLFHPQRSNNYRSALLHHSSFLILSIFAVIALSVSQLFVHRYHPEGFVLGYSSTINSSEIISYTNQKRAEQGLPALTANEKLAQAAQAKARDMFAKQYWAHVSPDGRQPWSFIAGAGYEYTNAGENLARDFDTSENVVQAWMESATHKANIVNPKYTEIGIGVANGTLEGVETTLVVQMFGRPQPVVIATVEPDREQITVNAVNDTANEVEPVVLSSQTVEQGLLEKPVLLSPLMIIKSVFLALLLIIIYTLVYDFVLASHVRAVRVVGKNMAHIFLFLTVIYLVLYYKGGFVL